MLLMYHMILSIISSAKRSESCATFKHCLLFLQYSFLLSVLLFPCVSIFSCECICVYRSGRGSQPWSAVYLVYTCKNHPQLRSAALQPKLVVHPLPVCHICVEICVQLRMVTFYSLVFSNFWQKSKVIFFFVFQDNNPLAHLPAHYSRALHLPAYSTHSSVSQPDFQPSVSSSNNLSPPTKDKNTKY